MGQGATFILNSIFSKQFVVYLLLKSLRCKMTLHDLFSWLFSILLKTFETYLLFKMSRPLFNILKYSFHYIELYYWAMFDSEFHYDSKNFGRIERGPGMSNSINYINLWNLDSDCIFSLRVIERQNCLRGVEIEKFFWLKQFNIVDKIKFFSKVAKGSRERPGGWVRGPLWMQSVVCLSTSAPCNWLPQRRVWFRGREKHGLGLN